ncbi:DUF1217 domain-containing protein [Amorphus orientalis]|uniref:DUF1217 domain-containing protein n=1 Tax=Amorphus orientalis TaxID=649198 RepID=A0AAE3VSK2_9HYPH|nr:DUF1217 domain-containing protein [Amorphus orientalis]MDQ0317582.1 hypothetical protein [Amorphus orientalis]
MISTYTSYRMATRDLDRTLSLKLQEAPVKLETTYYLENISKVKNVDEFLEDTRLFKYAMKAFGLEEMSHAKGLMRKILSESLDDPKAYVNRLDDDRFKEFALSFNFVDSGSVVTELALAREDVVSRYVRQSLESDLGQENEGVRLALYFERNVDSLKSGYSILADPALQEVVFTALGFPDEMKGANIDNQAATIEKRLDVASLKDPKELEKFLARFTAMWDMKTGVQTSPILTLFSRQPQTSIGLDLAMTFNQFRRGG